MTAIAANTAKRSYPQTDETKLDGIATGATVGATPTQASAITANTAKRNYPSGDQAKLGGIAAGAEVNVQSDWNALAGAAFILNKPAIPTLSTDTQFETGTSTTLAPQVAQVTRATEAVSQVFPCGMVRPIQQPLFK